MTAWARFRGRPAWVQVAAWILMWPLPLGLWAAARPREQRPGPVLLAATSLVVWVAMPFAIGSGSSDPASSALPDGTASTSTTVTAPTTTAPASASTTTTTSPADAPGPTGPPETTATTAAPTTTSTIETTTTTTAVISPPVPAPGGSGTLLSGLRRAPEGARAGYDRDLFTHWVDADGDRCDTREEVLIAESRIVVTKDPSTCRVLSGDWVSVYDGVVVTVPSELDIDHVVALAEAWDSGASAWDAGRREAFANDLADGGALVAVTASTNRSKSDEDPAGWRPPRPEAWCGFATDWVTVKVTWDLSADAAEIGALEEMLATCP